MSKGEKLRQLREQSGLSQVEAADRIGVSKQTLYKYEKDIVTNIPSNIIEKMATLYGTTPAYIFGWREIGEELARQTQPIADALSAFSSQLQISTDELAKVIELYKQIEVLPKDKQIELKKYLRFLQSDL